MSLVKFNGPQNKPKRHERGKGIFREKSEGDGSEIIQNALYISDMYM